MCGQPASGVSKTDCPRSVPTRPETSPLRRRKDGKCTDPKCTQRFLRVEQLLPKWLRLPFPLVCPLGIPIQLRVKRLPNVRGIVVVLMPLPPKIAAFQKSYDRATISAEYLAHDRLSDSSTV